VFSVELLERAGHRPGVQIDLDLSANLTKWIRPWWYRTASPSQPSDPPGSVRELLTTQLPGASIYFVRDSIQLIETGPATAKYYVATNGSDNAAGTDIAHPFA